MKNLADSIVTKALKFSEMESMFPVAETARIDTAAVTIAAKEHTLSRTKGTMGEAGYWSLMAHTLDFDDLHIPSTTHVSAILIPTVLATGGDHKAFLAGLSVMATLGELVSWRHYQSGWHATATLGALGSAVAAAVSLGLNKQQITNSLLLAVATASGVRKSFGSDTKAIQVGLAVDNGIKAAKLASLDVTTQPDSLEQWLSLVSGESEFEVNQDSNDPIPLAIKIYPCCYALQRGIEATLSVRDKIQNPVETLKSVEIITPKQTLAPLIYSSPNTGQEGQFSLEYAIAASLLDGFPGWDSFTTEAVQRENARKLMKLVSIQATQSEESKGQTSLLDGNIMIRFITNDEVFDVALDYPVGSPERPADPSMLHGKVTICAGERIANELPSLSWAKTAELLRDTL